MNRKIIVLAVLGMLVASTFKFANADHRRRGSNVGVSISYGSGYNGFGVSYGRGYPISRPYGYGYGYGYPSYGYGSWAPVYDPYPTFSVPVYGAPVFGGGFSGYGRAYGHHHHCH